MTPPIEKLAKIYLEGSPITISKKTTEELCEFIMGRFRDLPFAVQVSDFRRYETVAEMFADIDNGHLWELVENYDTQLYPNPFYGLAFLAVHDYDHYLANTDFSLSGEITAYKAIANQSPSLEVQKILYSEIVLKSAAHLYLGHTPEPKVVFAAAT